MQIPTFTQSPVVKEDGNFTDSWATNIKQLLQNMQQDLSNEGFKIPSVSSDPNSVTPPTAGGQLLQIQNSFNLQDGVEAGTLIFDPYEPNGATPPVSKGQLKILLNDGLFHGITNI